MIWLSLRVCEAISPSLRVVKKEELLLSNVFLQGKVTFSIPLSDHTYLALLGAIELLYSKGESDPTGPTHPFKDGPSSPEEQWLCVPSSATKHRTCNIKQAYSRKRLQSLSSPPYSAFQEISHLATNLAIKQYLFMQPKHLNQVLYQLVLYVWHRSNPLSFSTRCHQHQSLFWSRTDQILYRPNSISLPQINSHWPVYTRSGARSITVVLEISWKGLEFYTASEDWKTRSSGFHVHQKRTNKV